MTEPVTLKVCSGCGQPVAKNSLVGGWFWCDWSGLSQVIIKRQPLWKQLDSGARCPAGTAQITGAPGESSPSSGPATGCAAASAGSLGIGPITANAHSRGQCN